MTRVVRYLALSLCAVAGITTAAGAQNLVRGVIGAGGTAAISGSTVLVGTLGQPIIGPAGTSNANAWQGFWYTIGVTPPSAVREDRTTSSTSMAMACSPNPFSTQTTLRVRVPQAGAVRLTLFDALGREVRTLIDGEREAGTLAVLLSGIDLVSGSYVAQLEAPGVHDALRIIVVK